jgi:hypothetical protein
MALKELALKEKRSLNSQALIMLLNGFMQTDGEEKKQYLELMAKAKVLGEQNRGYNLPDAASLIREDRDR